MELILRRSDLREEFRETLNCSQSKFEHFTDAARTVIKIVGKGMFQEGDGSHLATYNVIYPK